MYQQTGYSNANPGYNYNQTSQAFAPPVLSTKVEIHISCQKLRDKDAFSKSDPMVVIFVEEKHNSGKSWREFDRTEVVKNSLDPCFVKSFRVEYRFEEYQKLKFEVYDCDSVAQKLDKHDFLGRVEITLGSIVGEHCGKVTKPLVGDRNESLPSTISFIAEEINETKETATLHFKAHSLDKKDFFGKSDPFLKFYRHGIENNEFLAIHQTEIIKNTLNPTWASFNLSLTTLCNGDKLRPIKIECFDWDSDGSHDLIGECNVTVSELLSSSSFSIELINPKKHKKKNYKNSGWLDLISIDVKTEPSFLDYVTGGVELCFHVAIDFTASNGRPNDSRSLHFLSPNMLNQYVEALMAVGKICEDYDSDKLIPAYGFGARFHGTVYHNFHLNQMNDPACYGVAGVVEAYQRFLPTAELYGPTNFSPIINLVIKMAEAETSQKYHILLILTDGVISDMKDTKRAIIRASQLPVSIIIIGVGNADFEAMDELDSDTGKLSCEGFTAERDIVQFVPYRKFSGSYACDALAKEVLYEVPTQLVSYMTKRGLKPEKRNDQPISNYPAAQPISS